ncbi:MAG: hypothetical protein LC791_19825 [Acidobacteria bacterium]|nr:hypothetical protein [Acidobacteriota bacterium]
MTITRDAAMTLTAAILLPACAACAETKEDSKPGAADERATAAPSVTRAFELTDHNLNAYERGLKKEIEAVRSAQERSRAATTARERGEAIQAAFEDATIVQGAAAAGLPIEQYRELRETIHGIFRTLDFQGKIDGPLSMDLSRADDATTKRLARDPFADLSSGSAAALRAQMDRLVPLWIEYVSLTAVAG